MRASILLWLLCGGSVLSATGCFQDQINQGAARLAVLAAGEVVDLANSDDGCGFTSLDTLLFSLSDLALADADDGGDIKATWNVDGCRVGAEELALAQENCVGDQTWVKGLATVTGDQTITLAPGLPPTVADPHGVDIRVADADLFELSAFEIFGGEDEPAAKVTLHHGHLSAEIEPALGESRANPGTYAVQTPIARISHLRLTGVAMTIEAQGNTIDLDIDDSDITAVTGPSFDEDANSISGTITIGGEEVEVAGELHAGLTEKQLEATYACADDLAGPVR